MPKRKAEAARFLRSLGFQPIPLNPKSKQPKYSAWQKTEIPETQYDKVFSPEDNIGVILGSRSDNICDLDKDDATFIKISRHFIPKTGLCFGRKGKPNSHEFFRVLSDTTLKRETFADIDGTMLAEIRGDGHQTMVPPSIHPSGESLAWEKQDAILTIEYDKLIQAVGWNAAAAMLIRGWDEYKTRHHEFAGALAGGMYRGGIKPETILGFLHVICLYTSDHEPDDRERFAKDTLDKMAENPTYQTTGLRRLGEIIGVERVRKLSKWTGLKNSKEETRNTDDGNAERFIQTYGEYTRYCRQWGRWLIWTGQQWQPDEKDGDRVFNVAREIPSLIFDEAAKAVTDEQQNALGKWAIQSQNVNRIAAIVRITRTDDRIALNAEQLDQDQMLLNTRNGTVNLRTGGIQPHDGKDYITKICPVEYNPNAKAPMWDKHLQKVTDGNQELIDFLQVLCGYTLTGSTKEQVFMVLWGPKGTGKTTFIETLRYLLGSYVTNAEPKTFMQKRYESRASSDVARLQGSRMVTCSESEQNEKLAVALIKRLSGNTRLTAAPLYKDEFEFDPTFKLWLDTNHKPVVSADDEALWDRIILLPFTHPIRHTSEDVKGFTDILRNEAQGILAWAVEGALRWQSEGRLNRPEIVQEAVNTYKEESDPVVDFLEAKCLTGDGLKIGASSLHEAYKAWCRTEGIHKPLGIQKFNQRIEDRGFQCNYPQNRRQWLGLTIATKQYFEETSNENDPFGVKN